MKVRAKIDKFNRLAIPKSILNIVNITSECDLSYSDKTRKITITPPDETNPVKLIQKRLKSKSLNTSERTFLEKLLKIL